MISDNGMPTVQIAPVVKAHGVLGLGCWSFGGAQWGGQDDEDSLAAMEAGLRCGMSHFDTAQGYGRGRSERVVGQFLQGRRDEIFLATKGNCADRDPGEMLEFVESSLERLGTDAIDLYYIHWPRKGRDLRPAMEGLEAARQEGKIRAIGVSNFSVEQMEQISDVGRIDAHQLCYNLFWRYPEREIIPFCAANGIAVVTYSSIAQGILTGKFPRQCSFPDGDSRAGMLLFDKDVWPHVHEGVERLKELAGQADRPLTHLAIRWVASRPNVTSVLVGARNADQVRQNAEAMAGDIPADIFDRMTEISDDVMKYVPDVGNIFRYYP